MCPRSFWLICRDCLIGEAGRASKKNRLTFFAPAGTLAGMAEETLQTHIARLKELPKFYEALIAHLCFETVLVLQETTPGTSLPFEWQAKITQDRDGVTGLIWNQREVDDPDFQQIMIYLDLGTAAHWIFPVNAKALSWVGEDGVRRFSKGHLVRGVTASHFDSNALRKIEDLERQIPWLLDAYLQTGNLP